METIGNIYLPINNILLLTNEIKEKLSLPKLTDNDIKLIKELKNSSQLSFLGGKIMDTRTIILDSSNYLKTTKEFSFYEFLLNKMMEEAKIYASYGIKNFMLENIDHLYLNEPAIYWLMKALSIELKKACDDDCMIGMKINDSDEWSVDIVCRNNLNFVYGKKEKLPELYMMRNLFKKDMKIFVDYDEMYRNGFYDGFMIDRIDESYDIYRSVKGNQIPLILKIKNYKTDLDKIKDYIDYIIFNESIRIDKDKNKKIDTEKLDYLFK